MSLNDEITHTRTFPGHEGKGVAVRASAVRFANKF